MGNTTQPKKWYPPTNDYAFKCVFGNPQHLDITAGFIRDFFGIEVDGSDLRLLNSTSIDQAKLDQLDANGRRIFFETMRDITFDIPSAKVTIEMQIVNQPTFLKRSFYYLSRLYAENYGIDELTKDNYKNLKPVWSMNILAHTRFEYDNNPYRVFSLRDEMTGAQIPEWTPVRLGYFEIPKQLRLTGRETDEAAKHRTAWAIFFDTGIAPDGAPEYIRNAASIIYRVNTDPVEAKMLDAFEKAQADLDAREYWAEVRGEKKREIEIARNLLDAGTSIEVITKATGIPVEELLEMTALTPA